MGFFDKVGEALGRAASGAVGRLRVISHEFRPGELVWVYPEERIPYGSRIVVEPNQAAIIVRSGRVLGVLRQGEWVLDTAHVPGLRGVMQGLYEGVPLPVKIIFVNVTERDIPFGGRCNTRDGVPIQYHGMVHVAVPDNEEDIKRFALRIAAEEKVFTTEELAERMRVYINDWVESFLGSFMSIDVYAGKARVKQLLRDQLARMVAENWYLRVKDVGIDVDIPEDWLEKLRQQGYMQMLALASTNPQVAQFMQQYDLQRRLMDALREARGGNVAGIALLIPLLQQFVQQLSAAGRVEEARRVESIARQVQATGVVTGEQAEELRRIAGGGGEGREAGGGAVGSQASGYTPRCPYCGAVIPPQLAVQRPNFCPFCGKRIKWCPNGHVAPAEARFCPVCGAKLE